MTTIFLKKLQKVQQLLLISFSKTVCPCQNPMLLFGYCHDKITWHELITSFVSNYMYSSSISKKIAHPGRRQSRFIMIEIAQSEQNNRFINLHLSSFCHLIGWRRPYTSYRKISSVSRHAIHGNDQPMRSSDGGETTEDVYLHELPEEHASGSPAKPSAQPDGAGSLP